MSAVRFTFGFQYDAVVLTELRVILAYMYTKTESSFLLFLLVVPNPNLRNNICNSTFHLIYFIAKERKVTHGN